MNEIFKPIPEYDGLYEISNKGRIKSLSKPRSSGKTTGIHRELFMKQQLNIDGYPTVKLSNNGVSKCMRTHRVVATVFIENKLNKPQVNHIDGNKNNSDVSNLEWVTASENSQHAFDTGLSKAWNKGMVGKDMPMSKSVVQISSCGDIKEWGCASDAVRRFGFDSGSISRCCNGLNKIHHGFKWMFLDDYIKKGMVE